MHSKGVNWKMKRQPTSWEKISTNYMYGQSVTFNIYKEFNSRTRKTK